jgi:uncharacterized protein YdeI (YjbR/CyaY-like superfamily)
MRRPRYPMPTDVERALRAGGVMVQYRERPSYQQNDYVGWITRAALPATRRKRIEQMVTELAKGGIYMKMVHGPSAKKSADKPAPRVAKP